MNIEVSIKHIRPTRIVEFDKFEHLEVCDAIEQIILLNQNISKFWENGARGWAPEEVSELLTKSRMDRVVSFSYRLNDALRTVEPSEEEAHLISSWVTLGSLIESSLAFYFTVFRNDYINNGPRIHNKTGKVIEPTKLSFDQFRSLMMENELMDSEANAWVLDVQQFRNGIHFFWDKKVGTKEELLVSIKWYLAFLNFINENIPYPALSNSEISY